MKPKFTPRPWQAVHIKPGYVMPEGSDEIQAGDVLIAMLPTRKNNLAGYRKRKANARLIAAAPDLLAALKSAPMTEHPKDERGPCLCRFCEFTRFAKAAIAKAEGRA